ncbi:hypothetical protein METBIDRAFT_11914 [Metschnikowia bicuspidata var. bicuspidata NRRL YB-4993]|uniref:Uncharacterized protein n=1 Tax=Metschnikowia bicuspidata var. bicuspidata NRRL YB-4993 TaxID=869754 RepID=A0A1A0HBX7_9ASCO|nr:hypothetical protein METBIDRAFT_11914 [Metschnikowia bicuspidata var. bicuspidata NRRL YB-4993]OBA21393.1 hypothetical protein METBIDRAFT_11914 [Metschnikowia bicuspidata var. bicuspidata NRRL YB-4993]
MRSCEIAAGCTPSRTAIPLEPGLTLQFLDLPNARLALPFRDAGEPDKNPVLRTQSAVVLFENVRLKLEFYHALRLVNPNTFQGERARVLIIECGQGALQQGAPGLPGALLVNCQTPEALLLVLRNIPTTNDPRIGACVLNTVIIENLSAFYWAKRSVTKALASKWYMDLNARARVLMETYQCNVLVTMWDKNYERGFNARPAQEPAPLRLVDLTYTPAEFFEMPAYVFASRAPGSLQYIGTQWRAT